VTTEAEEFPFLRFLTRKRLVKMLHRGIVIVENCYQATTNERLRELSVE
jgi:hypothetical protein